MGPFLLCWVYLKSVCRGERQEIEWEAQPGQSISRRIYPVPPWSRLPSVEQIKLHVALPGASSPMPV